MSRRDARAEVGRRKAAARARLAAARASAREHPAARRRRDRRRRRALLLLALLILLLLLLRRCAEDPLPPPEALGGAPPPAARVDPTEPPPAPSTAPRLTRQDRPELTPGAPGAPPWLADLQLQVTARAPQLAACFEGARSPGLLRWTATVDPRLGAVTQADLEPVRATDRIDRAPRACALGALSAPAYRLAAPDPAPARVTLVLEF